MQLRLEEISCHVAPGAHAIVILDRARWHTAKALVIPPNITLLPLPPRSPERNPVENVWQFLRGNWLPNRVFQNLKQIVALSADAWNRLAEQPWTIMSISHRNWVRWY